MTSVCYPFGEIPLEVMDKLVICQNPEMVEEFYDKKCFKRSCKIEAQVTKTLASS
jgi:hypothetical protein